MNHESSTSLILQSSSFSGKGLKGGVVAFTSSLLQGQDLCFLTISATTFEGSSDHTTTDAP